MPFNGAKNLKKMLISWKEIKKYRLESLLFNPRQRIGTVVLVEERLPLDRSAAKKQRK